ncbi:hypothetical protein HNY73_001394 [Argiope bruennichi]|uniref:Uncharacterized protein n=1 Tax=Argiope bruennichi TaxID=94029 RepID=A0A8T0G5D7_ARGBR|nr:hypothetical protein HNY73_001394 [Argiope bruennichi]
MNYQLSVEEKKNRSSFWGKLFGTSKKSNNKEKKDGDSFQRQSPLYHSFHFTSSAQESSDSQEEAGNFTTLENSALMEMHRDSGIIFLNKNSIANCMLPKEEDRRVQFAPTPMNKYYNVDVKAAPARWTNTDENKENVKFEKTPKPAKPILRRSKENLTHKESLSDLNKEASKIKVNVTYIDGPEVKKTPNIPRTSTKIALFDRKNGSLPHLNVSSITKYGSLPRTAKKRFLSENAGNASSHSGNPFHNLFFPQNENNQGRPTYHNVPQEEMQTVLPQSREQPYYFNNSELLQYKNQRQFLQQTRPGSNPSRLSLGEPLRCSTSINPEIESRNLIVCYDPNCEVLKNQLRMKRPVSNVPITGKHNDFHMPRQKNRQANTVQQEDRGITYRLPNKALNEIGLPITTHESCKSTKHRSRSESPHYIPLSETYSLDKAARLKNDMNKNTQKHCSTENRNFLKPNVPFQTQDSQNSLKGKLNGHPNCFRDIPVLRAIENRDKSIENDSQFLNQARRQAIRSSMYVQKRRFVNKICKYKSKECEDGFSSMADDECSFNCSCSSCVAKFSRQYKRNMNKNTLGLTGDDKYFFIHTGDEQDMGGLPSVPEVSAEDDAQTKTAEIQNALEQGPNTTWYECNDSLCKTPGKENADSKENSTPKKSQDAKNMGKGIYENITQIINSATKQNFKPQDVERMFSTPISTTKLKRELEKSESGKKISRALFSPTDKPSTSDKGQRHSLSPAKSPIVFSDSVILLQEIFQKLSQECKELLQPGVSSSVSQQGASGLSSKESSSKYINSLVKNLSSKEISEGDFANIIGGIAQNIFLEAKLKSKTSFLTQSASLPDLTKNATPTKLKSVTSVADMTSFSSLYKDEDVLNTASDSGFKTDIEPAKEGSSVASSTLGDRILPDGWSKTPITLSNTSDSTTEKSTSEKETSRSSESELQLLEDVIRLGMGLSPIRTAEKSTFYAASPAKASKFKSKDVLSCKGEFAGFAVVQSLVRYSSDWGTCLIVCCNKSVSWVLLSILPLTTIGLQKQVQLAPTRVWSLPYYLCKKSLFLVPDNVAHLSSQCSHDELSFSLVLLQYRGSSGVVPFPPPICLQETKEYSTKEFGVHD